MKKLINIELNFSIQRQLIHDRNGHIESSFFVFSDKKLLLFNRHQLVYNIHRTQRFLLIKTLRM